MGDLPVIHNVLFVSDFVERWGVEGYNINI